MCNQVKALYLSLISIGLLTAGFLTAATGEVINACVSNRSGVVRIITTGPCRLGERALSWSNATILTGGTQRDVLLSANPFGIGMSPGNEFGQDTPLPAGTLSSLRVSVSNPPGANEWHEFIVTINGVATSVSCFIADQNTSCDSESLTVSISANDRLMVYGYGSQFNYGASPAKVSWSLIHTAS